MTDRFYIKRLKTMIMKYGGNVCEHCPLTKGFETPGIFIKAACRFVLYGEGLRAFRYHIGCLTCKRLNGIDEDVEKCPCMFYEERGLNPLEEAKEMIDKWEVENA